MADASWTTLILTKLLEVIVTVSLLLFVTYWFSSCTVVDCSPNQVSDSKFFPLKNFSMPPSTRQGGSSRLDSSAQLVLGAFSEEIYNAWFYETYYPVLLKIRIPDWSPDGHSLNQSAPKCATDSLTPNYLCPAKQHLDKLGDKLSEQSKFFSNIYNANSARSTGGSGNLFDEKFSCLKIRSHFQHFATTLKDFESYMDALKSKCPLAKEITFTEKKLSFQATALNAARKGYEQFVKQHKEKRPINSSKPDGDNVEANWKFNEMMGFTTFQNAFTLSSYIDSVRWANAFTTCQGLRLDINLIPPEELGNILHDVSRALLDFNVGYNISIPESTLFSFFYKLPLVDCVLAIESKTEAYMILRLLLPVTRNLKQYKLIRLNKIPFFIRKPAASVSKGENNTTNKYTQVGNICEIKNYRFDETYLVEYDTVGNSYSNPTATSIIRAPSTCGAYQVCRIPDVVHRNLADSCVEMIITTNEEATKDRCDFKCYPVTKAQVENDFPYAIQLTSSRFAVVGLMPNETKGKPVFINCYGRIRVPTVKQEFVDEATLITLPCGCEMTVGNRKYQPRRPCGPKLEIIHVTHVLGDGSSGWKMLEGENKTKYLQETNVKKGQTEDHGKSLNFISNSTKVHKTSSSSSSEEFIEEEEVFNKPKVC